ncbi:MAG: hypothetical protein JNM93_08920 [Bacteriovoracaceae bacterium]|nr:hypothetical protein [Bacteriovoracaceae bacterium]
MKVLLISLFILVAQSSYAQVLKQEIGSLKDADSYFIKKEIKFNKEQGTAWVEVEYVYTIGEDSTSEYLLANVPGLTYSIEDHAVVYDNGTEVIKCIELQPKKALGVKWRKQVNNPRCTIEEAVFKKEKKIDNSKEPWKDQNEVRKYTLTYYYFVIQ